MIRIGNPIEKLSADLYPSSAFDPHVDVDQVPGIHFRKRWLYVRHRTQKSPQWFERFRLPHGAVQRDKFPDSGGFRLPKMHCSPRVKPLDLRNGFAAHKYLLVAIVECLQKKHPRRSAPPAEHRSDPAVHRWMREPSAEREHTPCIVMREHHDRGDLSVAQVALEHTGLDLKTLADWMRQQLPASCRPDQDTLHLALAPTLPGVPRLVHSVAASGDSVTHLYTAGVWSVCTDEHFLPRAIRYAQLVARAVPLSDQSRFRQDAHTPAPMPAEEQDRPCDLAVMGKVYDDIAVHAAIEELRHFRFTRAGYVASSALM